MMRAARVAGFTLIELLTVIAIIAILATFTAVAVPRVLERAKIAQTQATASELNTTLSTYFADWNSFPPRYGYQKRTPDPRLANDARFFYLRPFLHQIGIYNNTGYIDPFSESYDTNLDSVINLLEFSPIGQLVGTERQFPSTLYPNGAEAQADAERQLDEDRRPLIYIPVNKRNFELASKYYENAGKSDFRAFYAPTLPSEEYVRRIGFPPARYDDYILISVGPAADTGGVLLDPTGDEPEEEIYHWTALRTFFVATRDVNGDGYFDMDYLARTREGNADPGAYPAGSNLNLLPNETNAAGPMILKPAR